LAKVLHDNPETSYLDVMASGKYQPELLFPNASASIPRSFGRPQRRRALGQVQEAVLNRKSSSTSIHLRSVRKQRPPLRDRRLPLSIPHPSKRGIDSGAFSDRPSWPTTRGALSRLSQMPFRGHTPAPLTARLDRRLMRRSAVPAEENPTYFLEGDSHATNRTKATLQPGSACSHPRRTGRTRKDRTERDEFRSRHVRGDWGELPKEDR